MKQITRKARRAAISVAVGMALSGAVQAQTPTGKIVGQGPANASITLTSPDTGVRREIRANPDGSFSISQLPPGRYRVVTEGMSREVTVAGGADTRVSFEGAQHAETVTITGSRIQRDTFNSVSPVQIITREESTLAGFNSTTSVLQSTAVTAGGPQINNAYGGFVTDGGPGANTISLRGLGPSRTLVLLNGRRVAPAGSRGSVGSADLNVLPTAIIDHIEILKDGASSIYGSDAVAGVINLITRKNIKGVTVEGQYNTTEHGGGDEQRYSITAGDTFDRGYVSGSVELYRRSELNWGDRDWMACQTDYRRTSTAAGVGDWGSRDFIDPLTGKPKCYGITGTGNNGVTINTIGTGTIAGVGAAGSVGTSFNRWRPNSGVSTGLVGFEGVGGGANNINVRDTFDIRMMNRSLISPAELKTGFLQGAYDLKAMGNAEVYGELLAHRRESHQVGYRQLSLDYARGSPLIPAGLANVPNVQSAPTLITNGRPLQIRAFIGFGNDVSAQDIDYDKGLAGIRGNLPFSDWKYDASATFAKSKATYMFQQWLTDRLAQSLDVVAGSTPGTFVCRNPANGCVAAPVLSSQVIGGVLPSAWRDWTFGPDEGHTTYKETTAVLNTTGSLFQLPHGRVKGALGAEYRRAEIDDTPSINMQTGNVYNFSSAAITRGKDSVWELYGELEVPVLAGMNFAEELTINVSGRYTNYKSYGGDTTYKAGFLYTPVKAVSLRGSHGTSYRAPALFEQFLGSTSGFIANTNDPCHELGSQDPTSIRARNCVSEGLPNDFTSIQSVQVNTIGGAGAGLKAETSKNTTVGIVLQPDLPVGVGSVSLAVDYYKIQVDNGVARVGAPSILTLCYNDPNFANHTGFCRLITRAPAGTNRALTVNDSYINVSTDLVRGFDFTVRVSKDIGPGNLLVNAVITKYLEQSNRLFATDPFVDANGRIRFPKMTASLDAKYKWKEWQLRYGMDWVDKMSDYEFFGEDPATSTYKMDTPVYVLHHLSLQYKADTWSVTAGVRNLADKEPPPISQGFLNRVGNAPLYSGFDYFGRTYFVNVTKTF